MVFLRLRGFAIFAIVAAQKSPPFATGSKWEKNQSTAALEGRR
jgi:hypothetical protein